MVEGGELVVQETQFAGLTQSPGFESDDDEDEVGVGLKPRFQAFTRRRGSLMEAGREATPPLPMDVVREAQLGVGERSKRQTAETPPTVRKRKLGTETQDPTPPPTVRRKRDVTPLSPPPMPPVTPKRPANRKFPDEIPCSQSPLPSPLETQVSPGEFKLLVTPVKIKAGGSARTVVRSSQWYENEDTQGALDSGEGDDSSPLSSLPDTTPEPLGVDMPKHKQKQKSPPPMRTIYTDFSSQIQTPATPPSIPPRTPPATRTSPGIVHETPPHPGPPRHLPGISQETGPVPGLPSSEGFFSQTQSQTQGPHRQPFRSPTKAQSPTKTATPFFSTAREVPSPIKSSPANHHIPPNSGIEDEDFDLDLDEDSWPIRCPTTASPTASLHSPSFHSSDQEEDPPQSFHPVRTQQFSESMFVRKFNEEASERRESRGVRGRDTQDITTSQLLPHPVRTQQVSESMYARKFESERLRSRGGRKDWGRDRDAHDITTGQLLLDAQVITTSQLLPDTLMETFPLPSSWDEETQ